MCSDFQTTTYGKWILAGEHAVLRGFDALVFPIKEKQLRLSYKTSPSSLSADYTGQHGAEMHLLFWSVLEQGMQLLGGSLNQLQGHFHLESNIPVGVGLGASAALCVAMSRWYCAQQRVAADQCHAFAKSLEHLFHGTSSGLDIAGVASTTGTHFKAGCATTLNQKFHPHWYLSTCNQIGITAHCIQQVQALWKKNPKEAKAIDNAMGQAVHAAKRALEQNPPEALAQLTQAINKACRCFFQWGLVSESLQQHMQQLLNAGALAVKPTGSGKGGYVLSLWKDAPPDSGLGLLQV